MSYQVIARKWRPQTFEEVTGQESITRTLRNAIEHERLHHAYLFSGARGVGKTTTARLLAKALNCHKTPTPNPKPCSPNDADACVSCREIAEGRSIDVLEIDAASNTGVDNVREVIINNINTSPARDRYKVFIIDEVHMLSTSSFNALLKTLEEPPPRVAFVMATTELHKVPDTILSRCQEFEFRTIPSAKIFERLKLIAGAEKIDVADEALREIARSGEGSMRDAQSNFDQVISFSGEQIALEDVVNALGIASSEMLLRTIAAIAQKNPPEILNVVEDLIRRGQDLRNFCRDLLAFFRDLLVAKVSDAEELLDSAAFSRADLQKNAEPFSEGDLVRFFNSLAETETRLKTASQPRYILEIGLIKLLEMRKVTPLEKLLERLAKLENALAGENPLPSSPAESTVKKSEPINLSDFAEPNIEKKTLTVDFPLDEIPFPVNASRVQSVVAAAVSVPLVEAKLPVEPASMAEAFARLEPAVVETEFKTEPAIEFKPLPPAENKPKNSYSNLIPDDIPIKLPPITSEELEHIEDAWLDNAYEECLKRAGDDLNIIKTAAQLAAILIGADGLSNGNGSAQKTNASVNNGSATAAAPKAPIFVPPTFDSSNEANEMPVLPENPTDEQLLEYARNHPLVKKVRWHLKADIVKVSRIDNQPKQ
ncbi:MAG TPA: DNA polymerase III subunit gamma/tau [Pyrinomonadaceae bacterium]|nr:DNA polymerase III subunit gamma/tau [Pyrinomonadaceae bacterium]